jgi:hypothetical protein
MFLMYFWDTNVNRWWNTFGPRDSILGSKQLLIGKLISNVKLIQNVSTTWNGRRTMLHHPLLSTID